MAEHDDATGNKIAATADFDAKTGAAVLTLPDFLKIAKSGDGVYRSSTGKTAVVANVTASIPVKIGGKIVQASGRMCLLVNKSDVPDTAWAGLPQREAAAKRDKSDDFNALAALLGD